MGLREGVPRGGPPPPPPPSPSQFAHAPVSPATRPGLCTLRVGPRDVLRLCHCTQSMRGVVASWQVLIEYVMLSACEFRGDVIIW